MKHTERSALCGQSTAANPDSLSLANVLLREGGSVVGGQRATEKAQGWGTENPASNPRFAPAGVS